MDSIQSLIFVNLSTQLQQGKYCDATVVVNNQEISVHKNITAAASPVLDKLFEEHEDEFRIELEGGTVQGFQSFMNFVYTNNQPDKYAVIDALEMAKILKCEQFMKICQSIMETSLDAENCLIYLKFANENEIKDIKEKCFLILSNQFPAVRASDAFKSLSFESFKEILTHSDICKSCSSIELLRACKEWLTSKPSASLMDLIQHIDLSLLSPEELAEVMEWDLTKNNPEFKMMLLEIGFQNLLNVDKTKPVIVGISIRYNSLYKLYDGIDRKELLEVFKPPQQINLPSNTQLLVHNNKLYAIGGDDSDQFISYDIQTQQWRVLANLKRKGRRRALFVLNDCIFTVGGYLCVQCSGDVESYTIAENRWVRMKPGPVTAVGQAGCVLDGKAYISGGIKYWSIKNIHEYNKENDNWTKKTDMVERRYCHAMFGFNHKLYMVGGSDSYTAVEYYDPQIDQSTVVNTTCQFDISHLTATQVQNGVIYILKEDKTGFIVYNINDNTFTEIPLGKLKAKNITTIATVGN